MEGDAGYARIVVEFLTRTKYDDGAARVPGSVLFFVEGGRLKCMVKDRDGGLVGFVAIDALETAWNELDALLGADRIDWRRDRESGRGGRK